MAHPIQPPDIADYLSEPAYASTVGSESGYDGSIDKNSDYAIFTPMVELKIGGEVLVLATGNESSPQTDNRACITSFQYGISTGTGGCGVKIEGIDTDGKTYKKLIAALNKDMTKVDSVAQGWKGCEVEFGWKMQNCNNNKMIRTNKTSGDPWPPSNEPGCTVHLIPLTLQTNFDGGSIKFILEATDGFSRSVENPHETPEGQDDAKKPLKDAIEKEFTGKDPKFSSVRFDDKNAVTFDFSPKDGFSDGYKATHQSEQESNVTCVRRWLNETTTFDGKGCLILYNPHDGGIVVLEDPKTKDCRDGAIGTYVVNGGNKSAVISFTPSIKWPLGGHDGSGAIESAGSSDEHGTTKSGSVKAKEDKGLQKTGGQIAPVIHNSQNLYRNPEDQAKRSLKTFHENASAEKPFTVQTSIEAELKVFGNPKFANPVFLTTKWISIVVLDPRYIDGDTVTGSPTGGSCEWVSTSNCNETLSNKKWQILGVDHQITSGSYVTTFKVMLAAPNNDVEATDKLGGNCGKEMTNAGAADPQK